MKESDELDFEIHCLLVSCMLLFLSIATPAEALSLPLRS